MKSEIVLIGIGEMAGVFARGFLRAGYPVVPVLRGDDMRGLASRIAVPQAVVVGVGEKDLHGVLDQIPVVWRDRLVLLQNELLPHDWMVHDLKDPTVISVWFEKKPGQDYKVLIPSPVFGPQAELIKLSLESIKIPITIVSDLSLMTFELVVKNLYILTINIAGFYLGGGTVSELWNQHRELTQQVMAEVMAIQFKLAEREFDHTELTKAMLKAFDGDLEHKCMGRAAPDRLKRALEQARKFALHVPTLDMISKKLL